MPGVIGAVLGDGERRRDEDSAARAVLGDREVASAHRSLLASVAPGWRRPPARSPQAPVGVSMRHRSYDRPARPPAQRRRRRCTTHRSGATARTLTESAPGVVGQDRRGGAKPARAARHPHARAHHDPPLVQHRHAATPRCAMCAPRCRRGCGPSSARRRRRASLPRPQTPALAHLHPVAVVARLGRRGRSATPRGRRPRPAATARAAEWAVRGHRRTGWRLEPRRQWDVGPRTPRRRGPTPLRTRPDGGLRAVVHADGAEDAGEVGLDGLLADVQPARDQLVGQALHDQGEHLALARRQPGRAGSGRTERRATAARWPPAGAAATRRGRRRGCRSRARPASRP